MIHSVMQFLTYSNKLKQKNFFFCCYRFFSKNKLESKSRILHARVYWNSFNLIWFCKIQEKKREYLFKSLACSVFEHLVYKMMIKKKKEDNQDVEDRKERNWLSSLFKMSLFNIKQSKFFFRTYYFIGCIMRTRWAYAPPFCRDSISTFHKSLFDSLTCNFQDCFLCCVSLLH